MKILAFETSCDDTAVSIVEDGIKVLANIRNTQTQHEDWGGVVPELAGRCHIESIHHVINNSINQSKIGLKQIDLIAVTVGPGLVSSLLVGLNAAKALAWGASRSMLPSASSLDRKIATPAPSMAPGTTPNMFPLEM